jgi:hypothetical protein
MGQVTVLELCEIILSNAKEDREKALILYDSALTKIKKDSSNHAVIGTVVAKYLERSSKTNDQLLNLMRLLREQNIDDDAPMSNEEKDRLLDQINKEIDNE